jgi:hypothetical protein
MPSAFGVNSKGAAFRRRFSAPRIGLEPTTKQLMQETGRQLFQARLSYLIIQRQAFSEYMPHPKLANDRNLVVLDALKGVQERRPKAAKFAGPQAAISGPASGQSARATTV